MKKNPIGLIAMLFMLLLIVPTLAPQKASAASPYADGEYSVPFNVLKDTGSEPSATAEYVVSPAKLIVQNGKMHVVMTLNNSSWWQYFRLNGAEVQVVSEDTANDKRVVKFEVKDIDQLVGAKIHIIVTGIPGFTYDNKYDIRFKFNSSNIPLAPVAEKPVTTPTIKPAEPEKAATTPPQKPAETKEEKKPEVTPKVEEKPAVSKEEAVSEKTEEPVVEKPTEPVDAEALTNEDDAEAIINEESAEEEVLEVEEVSDEQPEVVEESVVEEVEADSTAKSSSIWFIIIIAVILAGGVLLFIRKRKS